VVGRSGSVPQQHARDRPLRRSLHDDADLPEALDVLREVRRILVRADHWRTETLPIAGGPLDLLLDPLTAWRAVRGRSNVLQPSGVAGAYRAVMSSHHAAAVGLHELFTGVAMLRARAETLLTASLVDRLLAIGALAEVDATVRSQILLVPHRGDVFVADSLHHQGTTDFCYLGRLSFAGPDLLCDTDWHETLYRVLDLGCGAGVGAIIASRSAEEVVGTDVLPRCVRFGRLNAALNEVTNVSFQVADVMDGIVGSFDAVITHPPGVWSLTAEGAVAEVGGDDYGLELPARMIRGALDQLEVDGTMYAIVLAPVIDGIPYAPTALERICDGRPCQVTLHPLLEYYEFSDRLTYQAHHIGRLVRYLAVIAPDEHFSVRYAALDRPRWWSSRLRAAPGRAADRLLRGLSTASRAVRG
jgi:SAM-dependent methyltransferase